MTFGELLRQLLSLTGLKGGHLADALGYDVSYISRWINDIKLPSLKNNDDLFSKISHFLVSNSGSERHLRLVRELSLSESVLRSTDSLEDALTILLLNTYSIQNEASRRRAGLEKNDLNCIISKGLNQDKTWELIAEAVSDVSRITEDDYLELFTTTPLHYFGTSNSDFFPRIRRFEPTNKPIHVCQLINFENLAEHVDAYCKTICTLISYPDDVVYDFYEAGSKIDRRSTMLVLKYGLLLQSLDSQFTSSPHQIFTRDREIVDEVFYGIERYIRNRRRLIERHTSKALYESKYYNNYLMMGIFRYLLIMMHPIGMDSALLDELSDKYLANNSYKDWNTAFTARSFSVPRSTVIYKSAIMNYLYDGVIVLFGKTITLSKDERVRHLRSLIDALKNDDALKITIIDDLNPIMCRSDLSASMYLSDGTVFAVRHAARGEPEPLTHVFYSLKLLDAFNCFFTHLEAMPSDYVISGKKVIDFLTHGIELI